MALAATLSIMLLTPSVGSFLILCTCAQLGQAPQTKRMCPVYEVHIAMLNMVVLRNTNNKLTLLP